MAQIKREISYFIGTSKEVSLQPGIYGTLYFAVDTYEIFLGMPSGNKVCFNGGVRMNSQNMGTMTADAEYIKQKFNEISSEIINFYNKDEIDDTFQSNCVLYKTGQEIALFAAASNTSGTSETDGCYFCIEGYSYTKSNGSIVTYNAGKHYYIKNGTITVF